MILAIDFDGTIADTNAAKAQWIRQRLDLVVPPWKCNRTDCVPIIGAARYAQLADEIYSRERTLKVRQAPGACAALRSLSRHSTIYLVTARPPERLEFAREWLGNLGVLDCFSGLHSSHGRSKREICQELRADLLIDDDPRHLEEAADPGYRRLLVHHGRTDPVDYGPDLVFCRSWEDVLRAVATGG